MNRKGIFRSVSFLLAVIVLITSVPQGVYAETAGVEEVVAVTATAENNEELVVFTEENTSEESTEPEEVEVLYEEIAESEEEETAFMEATLEAESDTLTISASLESVDVPEKGYRWDKDTHTLTLDGANLTQLSICCNATVVVNSNSTIENSSASALVVSGAAENVTISGSGELKLISHTNSYALKMNNDSKPHCITISGASLTVNCINDSTYAPVYVKGELQVTDGATLETTASGNYGIYAFGTFKVTNGAKVITNTPQTEYAIYLYGNDTSTTSLIIRGEGSCLTCNKSEKGGLTRPVIRASGTFDYSIEIKDGGKLAANSVGSSSSIIELSTGTVDIRGGKIEVHAKEAEEFPAESTMIRAMEIKCNEDGLTNAKIDEDGNIAMAKKSDTWSYEYKGIDFTSVPDAAIGVMTGNSSTLTVATAYVGTAETPTITYQWYKNGEIIEGATEASYVIPSTLTAGMYEYYCRASATFTFGSREIETKVSRVYVIASGKISSEPLIISEELEDTDAGLDFATGKQIAPDTVYSAYGYFDSGDEVDYVRTDTAMLETALRDFFDTDADIDRNCFSYDCKVDNDYVTLWGPAYLEANEFSYMKWLAFKDHMEGDTLVIDAMYQDGNSLETIDYALRFSFYHNPNSFYGYSLIDYETVRSEYTPNYTFDQVKNTEKFIREFVNGNSEGKDLISLKAGTDGCPYARELYYINGTPIFAYYHSATDGSPDNRYYFQAGRMIEWIEGNGNDDSTRERYYVSDSPLNSRWKETEGTILNEAKHYAAERLGYYYE